jgi:hypothetical protein
VDKGEKEREEWFSNEEKRKEQVRGRERDNHQKAMLEDTLKEEAKSSIQAQVNKGFRSGSHQ